MVRASSATTIGPGGTSLSAVTTELVRDTAIFEVVPGGMSTSDGRAAEQAVRLPFEYGGRESRLLVEQSGGKISRISITALPFAHGRVATSNGDMFIVGSNDTYELHLVDGAGVVRTIVRRPDVVPEPVTDELLDADYDHRMELRRARGSEVSADDAAAWRRANRSYERVASVPAYETVVGARDGGFWVKDFVVPGRSAATERWSIYGPDGNMRGVIQIPEGFRLMYIDDDVVVGVMRDDLDVEYVELFRNPPSPRIV